MSKPILQRARLLAASAIKLFKTKAGRRPTPAELLRWAEEYEATGARLRELAKRRTERAAGKAAA